MNCLTELLTLRSFAAPGFLSPTETALCPQFPQLWNSAFFNFRYHQSPPSLSCHSNNTRFRPTHRYSPLLPCLSARQRPLKAWDRGKPPSFIYIASHLSLDWWEAGTAGGLALPYRSGLQQTSSGSPCVVAPCGQHWICEGMAYASSPCGEQTVAGWQLIAALGKPGSVWWKNCKINKRSGLIWRKMQIFLFLLLTWKTTFSCIFTH